MLNIDLIFRSPIQILQSINNQGDKLLLLCNQSIALNMIFELYLEIFSEGTTFKKFAQNIKYIFKDFE